MAGIMCEESKEDVAVTGKARTEGRRRRRGRCRRKSKGMRRGRSIISK